MTARDSGWRISFRLRLAANPELCFPGIAGSSSAFTWPGKTKIGKDRSKGPRSESMIEQLIANGIIYGCIIALAAIGLSLAYRILNFANFAHGEFLTLGAYFALFFATSVSSNI